MDNIMGGPKTPIYVEIYVHKLAGQGCFPLGIILVSSTWLLWGSHLHRYGDWI